MSSESDTRKNAVISIVGAVIFAISTVLLPLSKGLGGFLTSSQRKEFLLSKNDYYWDQISRIVYYWDPVTDSFELLSINFRYDRSTEFIWRLISLWGLFWVIGGFIGVVLVIIPAFQAHSGQKPMKVAKSGVIIGIFVTLVEYGLFIIAGASLYVEEWETIQINIILLVCFVIGWIALIVGYSYTMKEVA